MTTDVGTNAANGKQERAKSVLMLLTNAYDPDPRVRQEALALLGMEYRVRILAWDRDLKRPAAERMEGVDVERVFVSSTHGRGLSQIFFYALLYLKLLGRGLRIDFDVVHCHDLDTLPLGFLLGRLKRKPIIYDAHESFPDMLQGSVPPAARRWLTRLENFLIRRVDLLITVGEKLRRHFEARGARRSVVIGNWKRLGEYARSPQENLEVRRRLRIPDWATVVVCITQFLKDRQIEELLDAIDDSADVYLIIGGKGALAGVIQDRAKHNPRIVCPGFIAGQDIPAYTCAADVVYYGFDPANPNARFSAPNKLFEALAAGRPLITGDFGEIADVVRKADCGIVLPKYSAAEIERALRTLEDVDARSRMASNAKRFGAEFLNWEHGEKLLRGEYAALTKTRAKTANSESFRRVRIMHVVSSLGRGGMENGVANLIEHLDPSRFEHLVITVRGQGPNADRLTRNGVTVQCLDGSSRWQFTALRRAIRAFQPDVVHSRNWGAIEGVFAARWSGTRFVVHSEHGIEAEESWKEPWRRVCIRRLAYEMADQVLCVSNSLRRLVESWTGFKTERMKVFHNGVDHSRYRPDAGARERIRQELGLSDREFCIGCVANLQPVKDHMTLLRACERIAERCPEWRLLLIGDGSERPKLEAFIAARPALARHAKLLGSSDRVPELLSGLDAYVLPSKYEGISNSLLEAMAAGVAVVATDVGGNPEVITHGEAGLLFPVGDSESLAEALLLLESSPDYRLQLAAQGRERSSREFSIAAMVERYEALYDICKTRPEVTASLRTAVRL